MKRRELIAAMLSIASAAFLAFNLPNFSKRKIKGRAENLENLRIIDGAVASPVFISKSEDVGLEEAIKRAEPKHGARYVLVEFENGKESYYSIEEILDGRKRILDFERAHLISKKHGILFDEKDFFKISLGVIPEIDDKNWKLSVKGAVSNILELSYEEIKNYEKEHGKIEFENLLECISNKPNGELMGSAVFAGISLSRILEKAGLKENARNVIFRCRDGYSTSLPLSFVMQEEVILAYEMNGKKLSREHGFPLRLIAPGKYGMKNPKWIDEIEVVDYDYLGYWEQRGWSNVADMKQSCIITQPDDYAYVEKFPFKIKGIAACGKGVKGVSMKVDNGGFEKAKIRHVVSSKRVAFFEYELKENANKIYARAEDYDGNIQKEAYTINILRA